MPLVIFLLAVVAGIYWLARWLKGGEEQFDAWARAHGYSVERRTKPDLGWVADLTAIHWGTVEVTVAGQSFEAREVRQGSGEDARWWTVVRVATKSTLPSLEIRARDAVDRNFGEGLGRFGFDARFEATSPDGELSSVPEQIQESALRLPATYHELHICNKEVVLVFLGAIRAQTIEQAIDFGRSLA